MLQLSKKVEYGLIALRHMAKGTTGQIYTVKEISDGYQMSFELLAKIMQKLARKGYIASYQGVHGGYILVRNPHDLKVSEIINAIEEKTAVSLIQCDAETADNCSIHTTCTIKNPLMKLQVDINRVFDELTLWEMV